MDHAVGNGSGKTASVSPRCFSGTFRFVATIYNPTLAAPGYRTITSASTNGLFSNVPY